MTREEIIRMAEGAGCYREDCGFAECDFDAVARFAELVATAEREACAKVCEGLAPPNEWHDFQRASGQTARNCAAAIRARGDA